MKNATRMMPHPIILAKIKQCLAPYAVNSAQYLGKAAANSGISLCSQYPVGLFKYNNGRKIYLVRYISFTRGNAYPCKCIFYKAKKTVPGTFCTTVALPSPSVPPPAGTPEDFNDRHRLRYRGPFAYTAC